jgi:tyrosine-protein kinase Etk/Wzc
MNAPLPHQQLAQPAMQVIDQDDDTIDLASYLDLLLNNRWLILSVALVVTLLGTAYALLAPPVYQANILVQVEDSASSSKNLLGDLSGMFDLKSVATAEMEIIRSRFVISRAVDNMHQYISVQPKYFPLIGNWSARHGKELSNPGLFGYGGYVWGAERALVPLFNVPDLLEDKPFELIANGEGGFRLTQDDAAVDITGHVGEAINAKTEWGTIELKVEQLDAKRGAVFTLTRSPETATVEKLQTDLAIAEKGKQSGVISVSLEGKNVVNTVALLNEIGRQYIRQNVDRKSEEAEKSLSFLDKQLPELKTNLEKAEARYNSVRNSLGTFDLTEEAKSVLQQSVLNQTRMVELKQRRDELLTRFQPGHPAVETIDQQIRSLTKDIDSVNAQIKRLPSVEQDVLRLTRDVKVNTDLYISLLNSAQQLRLVKASKVGNARLLDTAVKPIKPLRPNKPVVVALAALIGLFLGVLAAVVRKNLFGGIEDPHEIEQRLGLTVSAAIPHSKLQETLYQQIQRNEKGLAVLAHLHPTDAAVESMRSFRTSLQFSMLDAKNNIMMLTGPTPGIGKSFVSANFAVVLASTGKRVLLVDADLRKGYLNRYFGLDRKNGLSEIIAAQLSLEQALHRGVVENVDFISTGEIPPRPAELLSHGNFAAFLDEVSQRYDFVVVDTAPVLAVSDALAVAPHAGVIFNIARGGISTLGEIDEAVKRLRQVGAGVTGIVFNDLTPQAGRYGYGGRYGRYRYAQYNY